MAITTTNVLTPEQLKKILEYNDVQIVEDHGTRYTITCPNCKKPEAYIEYSGDMRWIKCNRENNCYKDDRPAYNKKLWNFIAERQGFDEQDSSTIVKYINETLEKPDLELKVQKVTEVAKIEITPEDLNFLQNCDEIFKQAILQDNDTAKFVRTYLQEERGYSQEIIQKFEIGLLPSTKDLMAVLTKKYGYNEEQAKYHIDKLLGVTKYNDNSEHEFIKNNITIAWKGDKGEVQGFSLRKPTSKKVANKYMSSKGLRKSKLLFNLNSYIPEQNKKLVIVEGQLDALAATHISAKASQEKYHFVASGGKSVSPEQAELLQKQGLKEVILLIDNDAAGEHYTTSVKNLAQQGISTSIAKLPENSEFKDVDELLKNNPQENNFMEILENTKPEEKAETDRQIEANNKESQVIQELENAFLAGNEIDIYELQKLKIEKDTDLIKEKLQEAISQKNISKIIEFSGKYNKILRDEYDNQFITPEEHQKRLKKKAKGYKTGFNELDDLIDIEKGSVAVVAGRPSHGKTTLMLNMYINMIEANKDESFLFFSYEEDTETVVNKIIIALAKKEYLKSNSINKKHSLLTRELLPKQTYYKALQHEISECYENTDKNNPILLATQKVYGWIENGRMHIFGTKSTVEKLSVSLMDKAVEYTKSNDRKTLGAVYIDYTQKINSEEQQASRQQELQVVCDTLLRTTLNRRFRAPLILGAQVNRMVDCKAALTPDKMREAGDIEQDASIMIGIWDQKVSTKEHYGVLQEEYEKKLRKIEIEGEDKDAEAIKRYIQKVEEKKEECESGAVEKKSIIIMKNRNGEKKEVEVNSHTSEFLIEDLEIIDYATDETFE